MEDTDTITLEPVNPVPPTEGQQVDYFGVDVEEKVFLPDKVSYVIVQELNEGERRKYLNKTNKDIRLERQTGDAHLRMATGDERFYLLQSAIVGWNLVSFNKKTNEMQALPFNRQNLDRFLEETRPKVLDKVEEKVREMNPWLLPAEITVETIDEQINDLKAMREKILERDEGKDD